MRSALNINNISELSYSLPPRSRSGSPGQGNQKPLPVMPADRVTLSKEALENSAQNEDRANPIANELDLSTEEKQTVNDLKKRDAEVKAHEAAHMAAGGGVVQGSASYEYQSGPDGKMYAVGGEVKIDVSPENTPDETIRKMQQIRAAALAPAQPSGTDRAVAAQASQLEAQARMEKMQQASQTDYGDPSQVDARTGSARSQTPPLSKGNRIDLTT